MIGQTPKTTREHGGDAQSASRNTASSLHPRRPTGLFDGLTGSPRMLTWRLAKTTSLFEYPLGQPEWWYEFVDALRDPIVKRGFIDVWDRPGLGVTFNVQAAKTHLSEEDRHFFD